MSKILMCALLSASVVILGGCFGRAVEPPRLSLKDDVSKPPKAAAEIPPKAAPETPPKAAAEAPPKAKPSIAIDERARAEQWERCAQRHVDYQAGKLYETEEQKQTRDEICAELHRTDHARQ